MAASKRTGIGIIVAMGARGAVPYSKCFLPSPSKPINLFSQKKEFPS